MSSDTPRTNAHVKRMIDNGQSPEGLEYWARDLERELNAAKKRIKRLEDIIDRAANRFFSDGPDGQTAAEMLKILEEVREPRP